MVAIKGESEDWSVFPGAAWEAFADARELYGIYGLHPQEGPIDLAMVREVIHSEDQEFVFRLGSCRKAAVDPTTRECSPRKF